MDQVRQEIDSLLELEIIRLSRSPWAAPIVTVAKPDSSLRLCVDYRKLNVVTTPDPYQMPRADDLIDKLATAAYISTVDLQKGYYQVPVADSDIAKTAFVTPLGKFEFMRMPFGLTGAPATFQRLILADIPTFAGAYLDDVVIFSAS